MTMSSPYCGYEVSVFRGNVLRFCELENGEENAVVGPQRRLSAILSADVVGYGKLVRDDETGTIEAVKRLITVVIAPKLEAHAGRIVKLMGDGILAEFPSVVEAVTFAVEAQAALAAEDQAIRYRMGVNLGDVIIDGDDIQGDGVNLAARLEAICAPGGLCISDLVHQAIAGKTDLDFEDLGAQNLKNIDTPVRVWQWRQKDRITGSAHVPEEQRIKFCTTPDAVSLAYAAVGQGPPLVKAPNWMTHLEFDWQSEVWRHVLRDMSRHNTLVRFDQRGNGLSDSKVSELTFDNMVDDMATVADAAGLERFALLGISQGCAYSIAYAHRYPERVSHLVLYGGFTLGLAKIKDGQYRSQYEMLHRMILDGWGRDNPAFRQFFTSLFMPGANKDQMSWFNELQRKTVSPETAAELLGVACHVDVTHLLAEIDIPTLVLHCRDDAVAPFEGGRRVAAGIPNARFVALEGQNHMILEDEPAWPRLRTEVRQFLAEGV